MSRSSYTEMVHQELVHHHLATAGPAGEATTNTSSALGRLVTTLTEWLVILQGKRKWYFMSRKVASNG